MGLDQTFRDGVATINTVTRDLQANIVHFAWTDQSSSGDPVYTPASGTLRKAVVEPMNRMRHMDDGRVIEIMARVIFVEIVPPNGGSKRTSEPFDLRDKVQLPDGTTGPIIDIKGVTDPTTTRSYHNEVLIGKP